MSDSRQWRWMAGFGVPLVLAPIWPSLAGRLLPDHFVSGRSGLILLLMIGAAAITDLMGKKIFNWTTYPGFLLAIVFNGIASLTDQVARASDSVMLPAGEIGIAASSLGALGCFLPMIMIRNFTGGGAGDVKLATAIGALIGASLGIKVIVFCYIVGGACALAKLIWINGPVDVFGSLARRLGSQLLPGFVLPPTTEQTSVVQGRMALGPYFAIATILVLSGVEGSWLFSF